MHGFGKDSSDTAAGPVAQHTGAATRKRYTVISWQITSLSERAFGFCALIILGFGISHNSSNRLFLLH